MVCVELLNVLLLLLLLLDDIIDIYSLFAEQQLTPIDLHFLILQIAAKVILQSNNNEMTHVHKELICNT
jgi:hypothetical protein